MHIPTRQDATRKAREHDEPANQVAGIFLSKIPRRGSTAGLHGPFTNGPYTADRLGGPIDGGGRFGKTG
jgi:hypothetical protein